MLLSVERDGKWVIIRHFLPFSVKNLYKWNEWEEVWKKNFPNCEIPPDFLWYDDDCRCRNSLR